MLASLLALYASVHGIKMYYELHGDGPPLVILHGGTGTIEFWPEAIAHFSRKFRVIALEQIGHGRTNDDPKRPMTYHGMAEDTAELLHQLGVEKALVLGWSDGGIVGLDLAVNHPALVRKLAVTGANYLPSPESLDAPAVEWLQRVKARCEKADKPDACWPAQMREPYERLSPDGPAHWPIVFERLRHMWLTEPRFTHEQLQQITAPALIVGGDDDMVKRHQLVDLYDAIPGARLWIVPNAGHMVPHEQAPLFNQTVEAFFLEPDGKKHD